MVERLFLAVPRGCLQFVIVVFPDHTHLLFLFIFSSKNDLMNDEICFTATLTYSRPLWIVITLALHAQVSVPQMLMHIKSGLIHILVYLT